MRFPRCGNSATHLSLNPCGSLNDEPSLRWSQSLHQCGLRPQPSRGRHSTCAQGDSTDLHSPQRSPKSVSVWGSGSASTGAQGPRSGRRAHAVPTGTDLTGALRASSLLFLNLGPLSVQEDTERTVRPEKEARAGRARNSLRIPRTPECRGPSILWDKDGHNDPCGVRQGTLEDERKLIQKNINKYPIYKNKDTTNTQKMGAEGQTQAGPD